ncbi:MAG TPA: ATP-binding protein, partial [Levilinea sp.]|nr:ATP-binding protein [Levilinea sp.]
GFILLQDGRYHKLTFYPASSHALERRCDLAGSLEEIGVRAAASRSPVTAAVPMQTTDNRGENLARYLVLAVPMVSRNRLVGVLEVMKKHGEEFSTTDRELMLVLAADAAIAIENAYLFHQTDLITDLVHELRTPLASLNTLSALLQRPEISVEQRLGFARTIHKETQRLNELAANFLDLALLESGRTRFQRMSFDPLQMLVECCQVVEPGAVESGIDVVRNMPETLPPIDGDRDKVKQVFFNLFSNAVKYNHPGGKIYVQAQVEPEHVIFEIKDTGMGIPAESLPHLFKKFYRASTSVSGAGLGLSISKRIIESHGGRIEAQSQLGKGATFRVYLPR